MSVGMNETSNPKVSLELVEALRRLIGETRIHAVCQHWELLRVVNSQTEPALQNPIGVCFFDVTSRINPGSFRAGGQALHYLILLPAQKYSVRLFLSA